MNPGSSSSSTDITPGASIQEYSIKVPKNTKKKFHVMRFNGNLNIDFTKWNQVKLERENNMRDAKIEEEQPKFGAGSEFGREAKEEARKKKFGISSKKYKPEDQPWILKSGGKTGKKFKGIREGGVAENASYYVFTHGPDGSIEAFPLSEWYNFQPIMRYKHLSAEEAEEEFGRRNKVMNYFSLMLQKRLKNTEDGELDEGEELKKGAKKNKEKDLKISDMDEWMDSDIDDSSEDEDGEKKKKDIDDDDDDSDKKKKKKKKEEIKKKMAQKKKKQASDESAFEESDDGDEEGRELDYISDSSEDVSDHDEKARKELKGVTEEKALRKLLNSDDEDDESDSDENKSENEEEDEQDEQETPTKDKKKKKTKDKTKKKDKNKGKDGKDDENNEDSSDSPDIDSSDDETKKKSKTDPVGTPSSQESNAKRAIAAVNSNQDSPAKKPRLDPINFNDSGISEEAVRRYLIRKPMTATELLQKFKRPKTNLSSEQLVTVMTSILKRINPTKQTIKNKMYLSLKPS